MALRYFIFIMIIGITTGIILGTMSIISTLEQDIPLSFRLWTILFSFIAPIGLSLLSAGFVAVLMYLFSLLIRNKPEGWGPFQSDDVREISQHLTDEEKYAAKKSGGLSGLFFILAFGIIFLLWRASALSWSLMIFLIVLVMVILEIVLSHYQKKWLCSTEWAKMQGYTPDTIRLWNYRLFKTKK